MVTINIYGLMSTSFHAAEYQKLIDDSFTQILSFSESIPIIKALNVQDHILRLLKYTVEGGKHLRSCITLCIGSEYSKNLGLDYDLSKSAITALTIEMVFTPISFFSFP